MFFIGKSFATHIVGGELYYDFIGGSSYRVTLKLYRDCFNGQAPFDGQNGNSPALLHVFNAAGSLVQQIDLGIPIVTNVPPSINNPCIQTPGGICVEEGKYQVTLTLPLVAGGYKLVYQRCCRNNTVLNLINSGAQGASYQAFIPGPETALVNSSPRYNNFPQIFICNGLDIAFDHKATDPDGDVLIYSLCSPYNGLDGCCPIIANPAFAPNTGPSCVSPPAICPTAAIAPPYALVNFVAPYNGSYPIASNPSLAINSSSGLLNGKPNINGQWVVGICVEEWRNGNLLSKHYRDFQFNVVTCSVTVVSAVQDQPSKCQGDTVNFVNNSFGANTFHWDFGINEIITDTSNLTNPTYVYPDTGVYNVTLIANPGKPCADTIKKAFYIYPRLDIAYVPQSVQCLKKNNFNFNVFGSYINSATFSWDFGAAATPSTSIIKNPSNVVFTQPGKYFVKVIGKQYTCIDSFIDSVRILARPTAIINNFPIALCDPGKISFSNGSVSEFPSAYMWSFSDSTYSFEYQPTKIFSPAGIYSASLTLLRGAPCPDTSQTSINTITVNPVPTAYYVATPTVVSIFEPLISFVNGSTPDAIKFNYDFGDGESSDFMNEQHTYRIPRTYTVTQTVYNKFGCSDKHLGLIKIEPEFRFFIPNTFTPDENNLNDIFQPITIGVSEFNFEIFDRWGHQVYSSNDIEKGWDGKLKGIVCKQDVYVWKISYLNEVTRRYEIKTGHVLLLNDSGEF